MLCFSGWVIDPAAFNVKTEYRYKGSQYWKKTCSPSRTLGDLGIVSVFLVLDVYKAEPGSKEVYFCVSDSEANQFADAVLTSLKPKSRAGRELSNAWFAARRAAVSRTCLCENVSYEAREHFITLVTGKTTALPVISWDGVIYH